MAIFVLNIDFESIISKIECNIMKCLLNHQYNFGRNKYYFENYIVNKEKNNIIYECNKKTFLYSINTKIYIIEKKQKSCLESDLQNLKDYYEFDDIYITQNPYTACILCFGINRNLIFPTCYYNANMCMEIQRLNNEFFEVKKFANEFEQELKKLCRQYKI